MSRVVIEGNASGTGNFTIAAPNSNTDRTLTLPDVAGTVLTSGSNADFPAGSVLQVAQASAAGEFSSSSTSFVDTGLITLSFPNNIQSGNKVLVQIEATIGEAYSGNWANPMYLTAYCTSQSANIGDSTTGIVGGNAVSNAYNSANNYDMERLYGSLLYTPTVTNPTLKLYMRSIVAFVRNIGSSNASSVNYDVGGTRMTIMEISA